MQFLLDNDSTINIVSLLICIILKDFALIPVRDIHILKTLNQRKSPQNSHQKFKLWLETLTAFEYQDEQMYRTISPNDLNRVYYLKTFLYNLCYSFVDEHEILGLLANTLMDLSHKSKASPKIVRYFDFLLL